MDILEKYKERLYQGTIVLMANVYGKTKVLNQKNINYEAEFFTEEEINEIITALKKNGYNLICYFNENEFIQNFLEGNIKIKDFVVFNFARNGYGVSKKSLIPAFCDLNNIKYTASDGYSCSLARNKYHVNALLNTLGIKNLPSYVYMNGEWLNNIMPTEFSIKYIVKPLYESASQGITEKSIITASTKKEFYKSLEEINSSLKGTPLIIQKFINGYEAKTTIIEFEDVIALEPVGVEIDEKRNLGDLILTEDIAFNYSHKNYVLSKELGEDISSYIKNYSIKIYKLLQMKNYGRIDCRIESNTRNVYFMDFSTMPYFVSNGEMLYSFQLEGIDMIKLVNIIINSALISKYNYSL